MNLYHPLHLLLLLVLLPLVALMILLSRKRAKRFSRFAEPPFMAEYLQSFSPFYQIMKIVLTLLALVFIILALVRPQWDYETRNYETSGLDIIICLDISKSMDAQDLTPTRLLRAKLQTNTFINKLKGDRIGIIAFAGTATMECPLTDDYESAGMVLNSLNTNTVVQQGTDIGSALALAEQGFQTSGGSNVLLLITDGEDLGGSALAQAKRLAAAGIKIYAMGVGTEKGISITDPATGRKAFSRLDTKALEQLASAGGGKYYSVTPGQGELELILQNIYSTEKGRERSKNLSALREQYAIPAAIALFILIIESLIMPLRRKRRTL